MSIWEMENQQPDDAAAQMNSKQNSERKPWEQLLVGLEDNVLIECYNSAVEMMLEDAFIELLQQELETRGIEIHFRADAVHLVQKTCTQAT